MNTSKELKRIDALEELIDPPRSPLCRLAAVAGSEPPLGGRWRHSNGVLCCGTLRIAVDSFDTDPAPEFQAEIWEWVCDTLNKAQNTPDQPPP